jgi:hypothetical protein
VTSKKQDVRLWTTIVRVTVKDLCLPHTNPLKESSPSITVGNFLNSLVTQTLVVNQFGLKIHK